MGNNVNFIGSPFGMYSRYDDKYKVREYAPPKINLDKGKRPTLPAVNVPYKLDRETLSKLREKYDKDWKHQDLWWPEWRLERTKSAPMILMKPVENKKKETASEEKTDKKEKKEKKRPLRRRHSARYPRHYLEYLNDASSRSSILSTDTERRRIRTDGDKTAEPVTMQDINYQEMTWLVHGYVRTQCGIDWTAMTDIIPLVLEKCEVLETFDGHREREVVRQAAGTMTSMCGNIYRRIESFDKHGYDHGVRYLSIDFKYGGCTNDFGVTSKTSFVSRFEDDFPELLKVKDVREYKMSFQDYNGGGIITIKLDCDAWKVTFFKNYEQKLKEEEIAPNKSYWFYMFYCNRAGQNFKIVPTEVDRLKG